MIIYLLKFTIGEYSRQNVLFERNEREKQNGKEERNAGIRLNCEQDENGHDLNGRKQIAFDGSHAVCIR